MRAMGDIDQDKAVIMFSLVGGSLLLLVFAPLKLTIIVLGCLVLGWVIYYIKAHPETNIKKTKKEVKTEWRNRRARRN